MQQCRIFIYTLYGREYSLTPGSLSSSVQVRSMVTGV